MTKNGELNVEKVILSYDKLSRELNKDELAHLVHFMVQDRLINFNTIHLINKMERI